MKPGLYVFEGPNGAGKSTLARALAKHLNATGSAAEVIALSGEQSGTFAEHVYKLYHNPQEFGVEDIPITSEQLLFTAGHADVIERRIRPSLAEGKIVLLDRYWWSTWVYATVGGLKLRIRELLIELEREVWDNIRPKMTFLLQRSQSNNSKLSLESWSELTSLYDELYQMELESDVPLAKIANDRSISDTISSILKTAEDASR